MNFILNNKYFVNNIDKIDEVRGFLGLYTLINDEENNFQDNLDSNIVSDNNNKCPKSKILSKMSFIIYLGIQV